MVPTWQSWIAGKILWQLEKAVSWLTSRPVVRSVQLVLRGSLILLKVVAFLDSLETWLDKHRVSANPENH